MRELKNLVIPILLIVLLWSCQPKTIELDSGVSYTYLKRGEGSKVDSLKDISTNINLIINGDTVWTTYDTTPYNFLYLGSRRNIKGFDEVLMYLREGDHVLVTIPSELGYGEKGIPPTIPPNSELLFDLDILKVSP